MFDILHIEYSICGMVINLSMDVDRDRRTPVLQAAGNVRKTAPTTIDRGVADSHSNPLPDP